jgi:ABC-type branched-subunit amino acid transport system permease subunit
LAVLGISWDLLVGRTGQVSLGHAFFYGIGAYIPALLYTHTFTYGNFTTIPILVIPLIITFSGTFLIKLKYRLSVPVFIMMAGLSGLVIGAILTVFIGFWIEVPVVLITVPIALLVGVILAVVLGLPALRVKGPYLGLFTMCIPMVMESIVRWSYLYDIFKSDLGLYAPAFLFFLRGTPRFIRDTAAFYIALTVLFFSAVVLYKVATSKTGIVFVSILDDELSSKACGINVTKYKLLSFAVSGLFGTLSGCIYVQLLGSKAYPYYFDLTYSFLPITVTFLGGLGTIYGPIAGSFIYRFLSEILEKQVLPSLGPLYDALIKRAPITTVTNLIFSAVVLVIIIKWPRGIARIVVDKLDDLAKPRDIEERGPRIWKKYKKEQKEGRLRKIFSRFKKKPKGNESEVKT